jgi:hypothetical protein
MKLFYPVFIALLFTSGCRQNAAISALDLPPLPTPSPVEKTPSEPPAKAALEEPEEEAEPDLLAQFNTPDRSAAGKKYIWAGTWRWNSRYAPASIRIKMLSSTRFHFKIDTLNGANMGEISGIARVKRNKAYFDDREGRKKGIQTSGCRLLFINKGKSIQLIEALEECRGYHGNAAYFSREDYVKGSPPLLEKNFVDREVFPDPAIDGKFKALVGAKDYEHFMNDFHLVHDEEKDEELNARVFTGCVRGICPWESAVIMFDDKGRFWAALNILFDEPDTGEVHYYTNDPAWADKLPAAIEKWHEGSMPEIPVIYKNKPRPGQ